MITYIELNPLQILQIRERRTVLLVLQNLAKDEGKNSRIFLETTY